MEQKLAALQRSGCNDKISWARHGAIAYVVQNTLKINYLKCDDGDSWSLTNPVTLARPQESAVPFQHVTWSPGTDVAAIDVQGDIFIFATSLSGQCAYSCVYNNAISIPQNQNTSHELDAVVGFKWLDVDKQVYLPAPALRYQPGNKSHQNAAYIVNQGRQIGPYCPVTNRHACLAITKKGMIRLLSQISPDEARYYEVGASLETRQEPVDDLITHATIKGSPSGVVTIATYSRSGLLKVYKVTITWAVPPRPSNVPQNHPPPTNLPSTDFATFKIERVLRTGLLAPPTTGLEEQKFLTHLVLVPQVPLKNATNSATDELYAAFTSTKGTTIQIFDISTDGVTLHNSFYSLSNKKDASTIEDTTVSLHLKTTIEKDPVLRLEMASFDTFISILTFQGELDLRAQQKPPRSENPAIVKGAIESVLQVGYHFPKVDLVEEACVSHNLVSYIYLQDDVLKIRYLRSDIDYSDESKRIDAVIALSVRSSAACFMTTCSDDIMCLMKQELHKLDDSPNLRGELLTLMMKEPHRSMNFGVDLASDYAIDKLLMNPTTQRIFAIQLSLSTNAGWQRSPLGSLAWATLNLRLVGFALAFTLRTLSYAKPAVNGSDGDQRNNAESKALQVHMMIGLLRWTCDFITSIAQELFIAGLDSPGTYYKENRVSVAMTVLLGKIPRGILLQCLRGFRGLDGIALKNCESATSLGPMPAALRRLRETSQTSPVSLALFEKMVSEIDTSAKANFHKNEKSQANQEELMLKCRIPDDYLQLAARIVEIFRKFVQPEINIPVLHFYDTTWLGLSEEPIDGEITVAIAAESETASSDKIDQLRKVYMPSNEAPAKYRVCTKCGIWSNWDMPKHGNFLWVMAFQKHCLCGGSWYRP